MIVAMQDTATEEQIQHVIEHLVRMGFSVHRTTGERQTVLAAVGARVDFDTRNLEVLARRRARSPHQRALQAGRTSFRPEGTIVELRQRREDRRQRGCRDGRSVLGGVARTTFHRRRTGGQGRGARPARRRIQTAQLALLVSGTWAKKAEVVARGRRRISACW